jgi:hypothetical protein
MSRSRLCALVFALALAGLLAGCPAKTVKNYYLVPDADSFPGTPASASNLAEDAKALSPGGQDVTAVRVFWNGHDRQEAVVLFETRSFLLSMDAGGWDRFIYYHHLWATYFNGTALSKPVELLGADVNYIQITEPDNPSSAIEWANITDTAYVLFYRSSTQGAFGAAASSTNASEREGDAVIFFKRTDNDTASGVTTGGLPKNNANVRLYYSYFDTSQAAAAYAETQDVVGTGASSERVFRYGFLEEAVAVSDEVSWSGDVSSINNVWSFGVLADGILGQMWWNPDANEGDNGATFTHFLTAVWVEQVEGDPNDTGVLDRTWAALRQQGEVDFKLMAATLDLHTGLFSAPGEIALDASAGENASDADFSSPGDSALRDSFVTYDNQVFFTYLDASIDNDSTLGNDYEYNEGTEGFDTVLGWNIFALSGGTTTGAGSFLSASVELSPANALSYMGADLGAGTGDIPDLVHERTGDLDNRNGVVVFGADEGLEVTYIFFTHSKSVAGVPPWPADDTDLYAAQVRHNAGPSYFTPADDLLEIDTLDDDVTAVDYDTNSAMSFSIAAASSTVAIGTTTASTDGPTFDFGVAPIPYRLVTVGTETRLCRMYPNAGSGQPVYETLDLGPTYLDRDFVAAATDQPATIEAWHRSVQNDWQVVLNKSSAYFYAFFRQQDATNQSIGLYGTPTPLVRYEGADVGLYVSRLTATGAGGTPAALGGQALVGANALRLDDNTTTTHTNATTKDPTAASQFRNDVMAFKVQQELGNRPISIQSDLDRISVVWVTVDDDNPAGNDARNTNTGSPTQSFEVLRAARVLNGATLTAEPSGGAEIGRLSFGFYAEDQAGTVADNDFQDVQILDAGIAGDCVIYFPDNTAGDVQVGSTPVYQPDYPADMRLFAANFNGTSTVTTKQISTSAASGTSELLFLWGVVTRGISQGAVNGQAHMILWMEARYGGGPTVGGGGMAMGSGGAIRTLAYNKAVPEQGDTAAVLVNASGAFTPDVTSATADWPFHVDFDAGDALSFPVGMGFRGMDVGAYFLQFGEVYYNRYTDATQSWYTDPSGLPAPTLVSNDTFGGLTMSFMTIFTGGTDMFAVSVDGNYMVEEFTPATGTFQGITCKRYDNLGKALVFWAKDDGAYDSEGDGTGFNRLLARIHE